MSDIAVIMRKEKGDVRSWDTFKKIMEQNGYDMNFHNGPALILEATCCGYVLKVNEIDDFPVVDTIVCPCGKTILLKWEDLS